MYYVIYQDAQGVWKTCDRQFKIYEDARDYADTLEQSNFKTIIVYA